jgi:hypothetical protein
VSTNLDAIRDVARAVSAEIVADELKTGRRVRTPSDPGSTYVKPAFRYLLMAADHGLIEVKPRA